MQRLSVEGEKQTCQYYVLKKMSDAANVNLFFFLNGYNMCHIQHMVVFLEMWLPLLEAKAE